MEKRVLIVEDEDAIRGFIVISLQKAGFKVTDVNSGEKALEVYHENSNQIDIVLLDVMMPGIDGLEVCKRIRETNSSVGIIMLTAKAQEADKVTGLSLGADDYITKPFSPSELVARINAVYRRVEALTQKKEKNLIVSGDFVLNLKRRSLEKNGVDYELTQTEYQIMELLMSNEGHPLARKEIGEHVWGEGYVNEEKIVDVNIRRLRMKLEEDPSNPKYIKTIWGSGYCWKWKEKQAEEEK